VTSSWCVVAGEDHLLDLLLLVAAADQVAAEDLQPGVALPHLLPEVAGAVAALGVEGVAGAAVVAPVEGQEGGGGALQLGGHAHLAGAHGEMHQGAAGKGEQRFGELPLGPGVAIEAVLVDCVVDRLGEVGLEFGSGHRQAIEEQHQVDAVLVAGGVAELAHHPQAVGGVAAEDLGVEGEGRPELGQLQRPLEAEQVDAVAEHVEGAALIELGPQAVQQGVGGAAAMVLLQSFPGFRLALLDPGQQIGGEEGAGAVVGLVVAFGVEPAVGGQVLGDLGFEVDFVVEGHAVASDGTRPRTSI